MKKQNITSTALAAMIALMLSVPAWATGGEPPSGGPGFTTKAVIPSNQVGESTSVFDLQVQPGQRQDLVLEVSNTSDVQMQASVETFTAATSTSGDILYTGGGQNDETLRIRMEEITKVSQPVITVPPRSTVPVTITLNMPQEEFEGALVGSVVVTKLPDENEEETDGGGFIIINRFSEATAIRLTQKGNAEEITPVFDIGDAGLSLINDTAALYTDVCMTEPRIVRGLSVQNEIYEKGDTTPLLQVSYPEVEMAPHSIFKIVMLDNEAYGFEPGEYITKLHLEWEGQSWDYEKEFTVDKSLADNVNANAANQMVSRGERVLQTGKALPVWAIILISVGGVVVIVGIVLLLIARSNQKSYEIYMKMYDKKANG